MQYNEALKNSSKTVGTMTKFAVILVLAFISFFPSQSNGQHKPYLSNKLPSDSLLSAQRKAMTHLAHEASVQIAGIQKEKMGQWFEFQQSLYQDNEKLDSAHSKLLAEKKSALTDSLYTVSSSFQQSLNHHLEDALADTSGDALKRFQAYCLGVTGKYDGAVSQKTRLLQDSLYTYAVMLHVRQLENQVVDANDPVSLSGDLVEMYGTGEKHPSQWNFSTSYSTRTVWQGLDQNDGKGSYSLTAGYFHPVGISASISLMGLVGEEIMFDRTALSLAYQAELFKGVSVVAGYSHYFYNSDSPQLTSSISDEVSLLAIYDNPVLTPQVSLTYAFSDDNDVFAAIQVSHGFWINNVFGGVLLIEPAVIANFGTLQSISREYQVKMKRLAGGYSVSSSSSSSSEFSITNWDFVFPIAFSSGILTLTPEIVFTIPVNTERITNSVEFVRVNNVKKISRTLTPDDSPIVYFLISLSVSI